MSVVRAAPSRREDWDLDDGVENWIAVEGQGTPTPFERLTGQLAFTEIREAFEVDLAEGMESQGWAQGELVD